MVESFFDEFGLDEFKSKNDGASFATGSGTVGGFMVEFKEILVAMDTKSGVAEVDIFLKVLL